MGRKFILVTTSVFFVSSAIAQQPLTYEAWLDSISRDSYIAREILLDELEISDKRETDAVPVAGDVDQALERITELSLMKKGAYAAEPVVRGLTSGRYRMKLDGMTISEACTDKMDPVSSYVEINNLSALELDYAGDGIATLSFELKKPRFDVDKRMAGALGASATSTGLSQYADVNISRERVAVRLSLAHRRAGDYRAGGGDVALHSGFRKLNYLLSAAWQVQSDALISFAFLGDDAWDIGFPALSMDVAFARARILSAGFFHANPGWGKNLEVKAYYNWVRHVMDDSRRDNPIKMDMPGETNTAGMYAMLDAWNHDSGKMNVKLDFYTALSSAEMTMYPESGAPMYMLTWPDVRQNHLSGVVNHAYAFSDKSRLTTTAGVSFNQSFPSSSLGRRQFEIFSSEVRSSETCFTASSAFHRVFGKKIAGEISLAYKERPPMVSEGYGYFLFNPYDGFEYLGDPGLAKEKAFMAEAKTHLNLDRFTVNFSVYHYLFRDYILGVINSEIDPMTPGARGIKTYANTPAAMLSGGELEAVWKITEKILAKNSIGYSRGQTGENDPLPMISPLKGKFSVETDHNMVSFTPEVVWASGQSRISEKFGETPSPGFALVNARLHRSVGWAGAELDIGFSVNNLLDTRYREHQDWGNIFRPGRNFALEVRCKFR